MDFDLFEIMFFTVFIIVVGTFIVFAVKGIKTWNKNNHSPRLTVSAKIVSKRTQVSHHTNAAGMNGGVATTSSTCYFVTFQFESGDRMEFSVSGYEYGMLAEGDTGKLSFQGTRYLSFVRTY